MNKKFLPIIIVVLFLTSIAIAQVIGSYKTSAITITLGKTNYVYSIVTPKDDDYYVVCPGIQISVPASYLTKQVNIIQSRLQKNDFSKCIVMDVTTHTLVSVSSITTKAVG
jgi:hypothetical protein